MSHFCNIEGWGGGRVRNCFPMMTKLFINNMIYWVQVLFVYGQVAGIKVGRCALCSLGKQISYRKITN